jgi:hypothetical protein
MERQPGPHRPLAAEREAAVERIQSAYASEVIPYDDMERRLESVLTAPTGDEVLRMVADLPAAVEGGTLKIEAINGRIKRRGAWKVPPRIRIVSAYGKVSLDLSHAQFDSDEVEIDLLLTYGGARIIVPRRAIVEIDALVSDWKQPRYRGPRARPGSRPLIRIIGHMEYGRLKVRHR